VRRTFLTLATLVTLATLLAFARPAHAADPDPIAAPLPSRDIRWSVALGGAADAGGLPRSSPGVVLGFDVRRGALGFHLAASGFVPQVEQSQHVGLFDLLGTVCALAPIGSRFDLGVCGGLGAGLMRAADSAKARPEGVAVTRFDVVLVPGLLLSLEGGTVIDPLRTSAGEGAVSRSALFSFRGSLGVLVRLW
jgi:hypothetical protein